MTRSCRAAATLLASMLFVGLLSGSGLTAQAAGSWRPVSCSPEVQVTAARNSQTNQWSRSWTRVQKVIAPDSCGQAPQTWLLSGIRVSAEFRVAAPLPTPNTSQLSSGSGRVRVDYRYSPNSSSPVRPDQIDVRFVHVGGEFAVEWRNVEVLTTAQFPATGFHAYARDFVLNVTGAAAWGADGSSTSPDPTIGPQGHYEMAFAWSHFEVVDGVDFAVRQGSSYGLTATPQALLAAGTARTELAADGAARLLARWRAPEAGAVQVSLRGATDPKDVRFGPPGGPLGHSPVTLATVATGATQHYVFVEIEAPEDFERRNTNDRGSQSRISFLDLSFTATLPGQTQSDVTELLTVQRPPVVLLHGIWGNAAGWDDFDSAFASTPFPVQVVDYSSSNGASFEVNALRLAGLLDWVRDRWRDRGIAVARVDLVTHSMGGNLARELYRQGQLPLGGYAWRRPDNFGQGDIRKLITITTPHHGSYLANVLRRTGLGTALVRRLVDTFVGEVGDAVRDLSVGSAAIARFGVTDIPSHTIVGTGAETLFPGTTSALDFFTGAVNLNFDDAELAALFATLGLLGYSPGQIYGGQGHDGIVVEASQRAGAQATTPIAQASPPLTHMTVRELPEFQQVFDTVVNLLHAEVGGPSFAALPAPPQAVAPPPPQPAAAAPVHLNVVAVTPAPVNGCSPLGWGSQLTITVRPTPGFQPTDVLLLSRRFLFPMFPLPNGDWTGGYFATDLTIGPRDLMVVAADGAGQLGRSDWICVDVRPLGLPLTQLDIVSVSNELTVPLQEQQLTVTAGFLGIPFDVTETASYSTSDPRVARVSSRGRVLAVGSGTTTIQASYGGLTDSVTITVQFPEQVQYRSGGQGSGGLTPALLAASGAPVLGNAGYRLVATDIRGGAPGLWALSLTPDLVRLAGIDVLVDLNQAAISFAAASGAAGVPGAGSATKPMPIPNSPGLVGVEVFAQALFSDPGAAAGTSWTNGFAFRVGMP